MRVQGNFTYSPHYLFSIVMERKLRSLNYRGLIDRITYVQVVVIIMVKHLKPIHVLSQVFEDRAILFCEKIRESNFYILTFLTDECSSLSKQGIIE